MNKIINRFFLNISVFIITICLLGCKNTYSQADKPEKPQSKAETRSILITKYMYFPSNEALLITDSEQVTELVNLLSNNNRVYHHSCGYHWLIWFVQEPTKSIPFAHNEECEKYEKNNKKIQSLLTNYFNTIKNTPPNFIFNVKVPSSYEPDEIVEKLSDNTNTVVFLNGIEQRLPYVKILATSVSDIPEDRSQWEKAQEKNYETAETYAKTAMEDFAKRYNLITSTKINRKQSSFGGGKIEDSVETTLYFSYGTIITDNDNLSEQVKILDKGKPESYIFQLVTKEESLSIMEKELRSKHSFILDIYKYPEIQHKKNTKAIK